MFRQRTGLIISIILMLFLTVPVFAKDTNSTISNISIRVYQNLRTLEAGSSLGNISESDFTTPGDRYHVDAVQWVDSGNADTLKVGSEPKVLLYLVADSKDKNNGDTIYYQFFGAYTENNVRISNGSFVSAKRISSTELEIVIQLKAITGTYDTADNLSWSVNSLGRASWTAENNSSGCVKFELLPLDDRGRILYLYGKNHSIHGSAEEGRKILRGSGIRCIEYYGKYTFQRRRKV